MGFLSNKIRREQLNPGDHIYTWRNATSYSHHGIYVGDGKVIHLTRAPGLIIFSSSNKSSPSHPPADLVERCSIEDFLDGGDLYLYEYGVIRALFLLKRGGTCTRNSSDPPEDVLDRASILRMKGFGEYNLLTNNCEDFAIYCKTGSLKVGMYKPGRSGQIAFLFSIYLALKITPYQFLPASLICIALVVCGLYCWFRLTSDTDVEKVGVEKFDLSYARTVRMEKGGTRSRWSLPVRECIAYTILVFPVWYWVPTSRILLWIRLVDLQAYLYAFVSNHLRNHPLNLKLEEYGAYIIWVLGYWYWSSSEISRIYFWTKLCFLYCFLLLFVSDHQKRLKLEKYIGPTALLLQVWYWTPKTAILLWIRSILLDISLLHFVPDQLIRNPRPKVSMFFVACFAIQSTTILLGLDYRDYIFRITKNIFL